MVTYPLNNIEYTAEDAELYNSTRSSGVFAEDSFDYSVTGADNTIVVGTGIAWIKNAEFTGKVVAQKEPTSINMGLPDSNYPRIDAVVIRFSANENKTEIIVKNGTPSSNPVAPSVVRTESVYELHLYHVRRGAGELSISSANITDLRTNSTYCGIMMDAVAKIDNTLTKSGYVADAKAVGDAIAAASGNVFAIESDSYPGCYYRNVNGKTEWINPPMVLGEEYRTTERYNDKPVYCKLVNFGNLPNETVRSVSHNISNVEDIVLAVCSARSGSSSVFIPSTTGNLYVNEAPYFVGLSWASGASESNVYVVTTSDRTSWTGKFLLKCTKTTD